jgi:hypothetical protein
MAKPNKSLLAAIGAGFIRIGVFVMLVCAGGILAWQYYTWFRWNYWTPLKFQDVWHWVGLMEHSARLLGTNALLEWFFHWPAWLGMLAIGGVMICLGVICGGAGRNVRSSS